VVQNASVLLSLSFHIKLTQASIFLVNHRYSYKSLLPYFTGSSSKIFRTRNHVVAVKQCLEQSPNKSTRRLPQETDLSRGSVMRIMH